MTKEDALNFDPAKMPRCQRRTGGKRCIRPVVFVEKRDGSGIARAKVCKQHLNAKMRHRVIEKVNRQCQALIATGEACVSTPLRPGSVVDGVVVTGDYCRSHDINLDPPWERPRKKRPTPAKFMEELIESNPKLFLLPYLRAAGIDYQIVENEDGLVEFLAVPNPEGGARLYGTSKDGEVFVSDHEDVEGMQRAVERILDRVYGKPRQSQDVMIGGKGTELPAVPRTQERAADVAQILMQAGATPQPAPHEGRKRRGAPKESVQSKPNGNGNGRK